MSASGPTGPEDEREVLSSLPRSRRQHPTARREAARAKRARVNGAPGEGEAKRAVRAAAPAKTKAPARSRPKAGGARPATAAKPATTAKTAAVRPSPARPRRPRRAIPPAGYATPRVKGEHGSADPGAALANLVRGVIKRLPL